MSVGGPAGPVHTGSHRRGAPVQLVWPGSVVTGRTTQDCEVPTGWISSVYTTPFVSSATTSRCPGSARCATTAPDRRGETPAGRRHPGRPSRPRRRAGCARPADRDHGPWSRRRAPDTRPAGPNSPGSRPRRARGRCTSDLPPEQQRSSRTCTRPSTTEGGPVSEQMKQPSGPSGPTSNVQSGEQVFGVP